jgi:hypothetical protein
VIRNTRGPLEEWKASVPQTAAQINEAFQSIQVNGLEGLSDALTDVITGTKSLKDAFGDLAKSVIADILHMTIRMLIFRAISRPLEAAAASAAALAMMNFSGSGSAIMNAPKPLPLAAVLTSSAAAAQIATSSRSTACRSRVSRMASG